MVRPALALAVLFGLLATGAHGSGMAFPQRIEIPDGFQPEGIAIAGGHFYVGSIPTGALYRGSLRTGAGAIVVPAVQGRSAIGLAVDRGTIFVAGGQSGKAFVYDAKSRKTIATLQLAEGSGATFVNDVVVTKRAAWFTDSSRPVLYRVPLQGNGRPGGQASVRAVALSGDFALAPGFNLNGIDATPNGKTLVVVQSNTGKLFTVSPSTGHSTEIDLGGDTVLNGDGILLAGKTLYVVQNQDNQVAKITLRPDLRSGRIVSRITDAALDVPTTIARFGARLYVVNARFGTTPMPTTPYWVTQLRR